MRVSTLHRILTRHSGTKWKLKFKSKVLNIDEVVEMKVPPLLDDDTIEKIRVKAEGKRTFLHGPIKHHYLFSRMIACAHCGYMLVGQMTTEGVRIYRHASGKRERTCDRPAQRGSVRADEIEDVVMRHLFETFGNPAAVQRAMEDATPNNEKIREA